MVWFPASLTPCYTRSSISLDALALYKAQRHERGRKTESSPDYILFRFAVEIEHGYISYARLSILQYGNETTYHVTHVDCQTYILITLIAYGLKFTTPSLNRNKHFK